MKKIATRLLLLMFVAFATTQSLAQTTSATTLNTTISSNILTYTPKANDVLTYRVTTPNASYNFTVILKTWRPTLAFDWVMSGDVNQKGAIAFDNADAADAMGINNFFTPGAVTLQGQTSVWLSARAHKLLKSNVVANIVFDNARVADGLKNCGIENFTFDFNGVKTTMPYIKASNDAACSGAKTLWVLDDAQSPLIVYMNLGWTIELKSIKQQ